MSKASEHDLEQKEKDAKWVTVECIHCGEKFPTNSPEPEGEANYCPECKEKLFKRD